MRVSLTFLTVNVFLAVRFFIHKNNVESKDNPTVLFSLFFGSDEKEKQDLFGYSSNMYYNRKQGCGQPLKPSKANKKRMF